MIFLGVDEKTYELIKEMWNLANKLHTMQGHFKLNIPLEKISILDSMI